MFCRCTFTVPVVRPISRATSEFCSRPFAGAYLPTGKQRDFVRAAFLTGAQASYRLVPQLAVTGTFAWSPTRDRAARLDAELDLFQYDVGIEGRVAGWRGGASWNFTPFAGLGVGGRTYHYHDRDVDAQSKFAGYGALGGELGFGRLGVRLEGRDYLSRVAREVGRGGSDTRNDVTLAAALTIRF
ncbi:MAG TPA: hypothetical protein VEZ47_02645 [Gemmatirosa sp.]|nr:hypothetical protein [Gemmatirosa sp.]